MANDASRPVKTPQPVPMMEATRRPEAREMAPVGNVPAASPTTNIESGTVASDISGASVAPTMDPVAKVTAELAPVSACAAASRATLDRARASPEISAAAVMSIIEAVSARVGQIRSAFVDVGKYGAGHAPDQPMQAGVRH